MSNVDAAGHAFKMTPFKVMVILPLGTNFTFDDVIAYVRKNNHQETAKRFEEWLKEPIPSRIPGLVNGVNGILYPPPEVEDIAGIYNYDESFQSGGPLTF